MQNCSDDRFVEFVKNSFFCKVQESRVHLPLQLGVCYSIWRHLYCLPKLNITAREKEIEDPKNAIANQFLHSGEW